MKVELVHRIRRFAITVSDEIEAMRDRDSGDDIPSKVIADAIHGETITEVMYFGSAEIFVTDDPRTDEEIAADLADRAEIACRKYYAGRARQRAQDEADEAAWLTEL